MVVVGSPERGLVGIGRGRGVTTVSAMDAGYHKGSSPLSLDIPTMLMDSGTVHGLCEQIRRSNTMVFLRVRPRFQVWSYYSHSPCSSSWYASSPYLCYATILTSRIRLNGPANHPSSPYLCGNQRLLSNNRRIEKSNASLESYYSTTTFWRKLLLSSLEAELTGRRTHLDSVVELEVGVEGRIRAKV